jgi:hypothetical protein
MEMHRSRIKWFVVGLVLLAVLGMLVGGHSFDREQAAWFEGYRAGQLAEEGASPPAAPGYGFAPSYGCGHRVGFSRPILRVIGLLVLGGLAIKAAFVISAVTMGRRMAHGCADGAQYHAHQRAHWKRWRRMAKEHWRWMDEDEPEDEPESEGSD